MKKLLVYLVIILLAFAFNANAEWIGCDPANDVAEVVIVVDGQESTIPYQLNSTGTAVLLLDIDNISTANLIVYFVNDQGRRSDPSVPFDLKARPSTGTGFRIVRE
jgi:hypothetical protein